MSSDDNNPFEAALPDDTYLLTQIPELATIDMVRVNNQSRMFARANGLIPELAKDMQYIHTVLDVGSSSGEWALSLAFTYPHLEVNGIDNKPAIVEYANARARSQERINISFEVMDALKPLNFPENSFDLVNARLTAPFQTRETWPKTLREWYRVCQPGGYLRLTETNDQGETNSPKYEQFKALALEVCARLGYSLDPTGKNMGLILRMAQMMKAAGWRDIHEYPYMIDFSANSDNWIFMCEDLDKSMLQMIPLISRVLGTGTAELELLRQ